MTTGEHDPFLKQITPVAFAIRALGGPEAPLENPGGAESTTGTRGSGGPLVTPEVQELDENEDSDPEIRALDRSLNAQTSSATINLVKGKVTASSIFADVQNLTPRKRKGNSLVSLRINPKRDRHYLPSVSKKAKPTFSSSFLSILDEHLTGGKSSRDEALKTMSGPTMPYTRSDPLDSVDDEVMEVEATRTLSKGDKKTVSFSGTKISSSLGSDCFLGDDEDQVSSIPPSWFKPEDKLQRTPDTEKQVAQLTHDLAAQKKTAQCQSAQAVAASAGEEKDKSVAELEKFSSTMKKNDKAQK
ncbi:hypothetical protein Hanom_Chr10g00929841 [Helianthus anomalus]